MKTHFIALICLVAISCGKKNETNKGVVFAPLQQEAKTSIDNQVDSDFDGLTDLEEKKIGTNPHIADLPEVDFHPIGDVDFQAKFFERASTRQNKTSINFSKAPLTQINWMRSIIASMAYDQLNNETINFQYNSLTSLQLKLIKCLTQAESKGNLNNLLNELKEKELLNKIIKLKYQLKIKKIKKLAQVEKIETKILWNESIVGNLLSDKLFYQFLNTDYDSKQIIEVMNINEEPIDIEAIKPFNNCINFNVKDFKYTWNKKKLRYREQLEKIDQSLAHIILLKEGEYKKLSVNPNYFDVPKLLTELGAKATFSHAGEIVSAFGLGNDFQTFSDLNLRRKDHLEKGRWFFLNQEGKRPIQSLTPGKVYYLGYLKVKDILKLEKEEVNFAHNHSETLILEDMLPGDSMTMSTKLFGSYAHVEANSNYFKPGFLIVIGDYASASAQNMCVVEEYNVFPQGKIVGVKATNEEYYVAKLGEREIQGKILEGKMIYEFVLGINDFVGNKVKLELPKLSYESVVYQRAIHTYDRNKESRCKKGRQRTNTTRYEKRNSKLLLNYDTEIVRRGIHR